MNDAAKIVRLEELVAALDSRQVQPDRAAEAAIAGDASEMRRKAIARLAELQRRASSTAI